jgi:hypothetical protein
MIDTPKMNDAVELWYASSPGVDLHQFLGLTWSQYAAWVERGELPAGYELPARARQHGL